MSSCPRRSRRWVNFGLMVGLTMVTGGAGELLAAGLHRRGGRVGRGSHRGGRGAPQRGGERGVWEWGQEALGRSFGWNMLTFGALRGVGALSNRLLPASDRRAGGRMLDWRR